MSISKFLAGIALCFFLKFALSVLSSEYFEDTTPVNNPTQIQTITQGEATNSSESAMIKKSLELVKNGEYDSAIKELNKCLEIYPNSDLAYFTLGMVYAKIGRYDDGVKYVDKAIAMNPSRQEYVKHREEIFGSIKTKSKTLVNAKNNINNVINNFMSAFINKSRQNMMNYGFCKNERYSTDKVFEMLESQISVLDVSIQLVKANSGFQVNYEWQINNLKKVDDTTYKADILLMILPDTLPINDVIIKNVNGEWKVDIESFAIQSSLSFTSAVTGLGGW